MSKGFKVICEKCGSESNVISVDFNLSFCRLNIICNTIGCQRVENETENFVKSGHENIVDSVIENE